MLPLIIGEANAVVGYRLSPGVGGSGRQLNQHIRLGGAVQQVRA